MAHEAFCVAEHERLRPGQGPRTPTLDTFRTRTEKYILIDLALEIDERLNEKLKQDCSESKP
jgi:hypothetical protein